MTQGETDAAVTWWVLYAFTLRATIPGHIAKTFWSTFVSAVQARDVHALRAVGLAARPYLGASDDCDQTDSEVNYSIAGPVSYSLLFIASTIFSEGISSAKCASRRDWPRADPRRPPLPQLCVARHLGRHADLVDQSTVPMFWPIEGLLIKTPLNILLGRTVRRSRPLSPLILRRSSSTTRSSDMRACRRGSPRARRSSDRVVSESSVVVLHRTSLQEVYSERQVSMCETRCRGEASPSKEMFAA